MQHVHRLLALGGDEHEIDVAAAPRNRPADLVQQSRRVVGDELEDRVFARMIVVESDDVSVS